jgi:hypothetical protein
MRIFAHAKKRARSKTSDNAQTQQRRTAAKQRQPASQSEKQKRSVPASNLNLRRSQ